MHGLQGFIVSPGPFLGSPGHHHNHDTDGLVDSLTDLQTFLYGGHKGLASRGTVDGVTGTRPFHRMRDMPETRLSPHGPDAPLEVARDSTRYLNAAWKAL